MSGHAIIFAGGGSGGHIYPNLAILDALREIAPERALARFVVSERAIDASICQRAGVEFTAIAARPFTLGPMRAPGMVMGWTKSVSAARGVLRDAIAHAGSRDRVHVVSTGGFVSAPVARAARVMRVGLTLVNLDASIGLASRLCALWARDQLSPYPLGSGWVKIAPIVRSSAVARDSAEICREALGLDPGLPTLLVIGGSQGANSLNALMELLAREHGSRLRGSGGGWQVVHASGQASNDGLEDAYRGCGVRAVVREFLDDPSLAWGSATLALSRAGAGCVGEAWANRTPCVFAPYPHHRDDHQALNAAPLVEAGSAIVVEDRVEAEANLAGLGESLLGLMADPGKIRRMRRDAESLGEADGAQRVARLVAERLGLVTAGGAPA